MDLKNRLEDQQRKLNDIKEMIALAKLEKMNILEEQVRKNFMERKEILDERLFSYVIDILNLFKWMMNE